MEKFQTRLILLISVLILFSCAKPEVVQVIKPGDEQMNCKELEKEVAEVQKFKRDAVGKKTKKVQILQELFILASSWPFFTRRKSI